MTSTLEGDRFKDTLPNFLVIEGAKSLIKDSEDHLSLFGGVELPEAIKDRDSSKGELYYELLAFSSKESLGSLVNYQHYEELGAEEKVAFYHRMAGCVTLE